MRIPAAFERWNPVNYVANWKTPMLVITGEKDFRIPYTQGIAAFTALQRRGIPSKLLVVPGRKPLGAEAARIRSSGMTKCSAGWDVSGPPQ